MVVRWLAALAVFIPAAGLAAPIYTPRPVTYTLEGVITQHGGNTNDGLLVGEQIPISITVDSAFPGNDGAYYTWGDFYPGGPGFLILSALFAGTDASGLIQQINVDPGSSLTFATVSPQTAGGFDLDLTGANDLALPTTALPKIIAASDFSAGTFSVTEAFSPQIDGFSGVIEGLAVLEPSPLAVLAFSLIGIAALRNGGRV